MVIISAICDCCGTSQSIKMGSASKSKFISFMRSSEKWQYGKKGIFCPYCKHHYIKKPCLKKRLKQEQKSIQSEIDNLTWALNNIDFDNETYHPDEKDSHSWMTKEKVQKELSKQLSNLKRKQHEIQNTSI